MIIAIDGPAGSGKSSTAKAVASRLGFRHLDSGAFYRTLTLAALRDGISSDDWLTLTSQQLDNFRVHAEPNRDGFRMFLGTDDVTAGIRSPEVNAHVSVMARVPAVRDWLLERLRSAARTDLVADGRDIGTVVFPGADLKIFLIADSDVRARRRLNEMGEAAPETEQLQSEIARLQERDRIDSEREVAPLVQASDAIVIDTSLMNFDEQVDAVVSLAKQRMEGNGPQP